MSLFVILSLISIYLIVLIVLSLNLKRTTPENGIYAVKDGQMIELRGNTELPLYIEAIEHLVVPSEKALYISSGYGRFVKGTYYPDQVYYDGVLDGDFYEVSVSLVDIKNDVVIFDSIKYSIVETEDPIELSLTDRKDMVQMTIKEMHNRIN